MQGLIIAEHHEQQLAPVTAPTVSAAATCCDTLDILVIGEACQEAANSAALFTDLRQVLVAENSCFKGNLAENSATLIAQLANDYDYIFAPASTFGKNLLPRVAALLDVQAISDIVAVKSHDTFVRPIYAGNGLATVQSFDDKKVITVRPTAFAKAACADTPTADIKPLTTSIESTKSRHVGLELSPADRPELTSAEVIVSGGRALGSAENFKLIEQLADTLGAAIGASRAAVDAGFVPNDYQVGQTGKIVAPKLYIAVGISGAIQHLAGMKDSKVIVAINKDPEAPIFQVANYGIVGDLFTVVPELISALSR